MKFNETEVTKSEAKLMHQAGWVFDWSVDGSASSLKVSLEIDRKLQGLVEFDRREKDFCNFIYWLEIAPYNRGKNKKNEGVAGKLLAYVARDSFSQGFDGFILFKSKTALKGHYINKYGGKQIGSSDQIYFDTKASANLINTYLKEDIK